MQKNKTTRKSLKKKSIENIEDYNSDGASVYCSTYRKYNSYMLEGAWVTLSMFNSYDEFMDFCRQLHADEDDPELMFPDYRDFPGELYSESCIDEDTFNKIVAYDNMSNEMQEAFEAYIEVTGNNNISDFEESFEGKYNTEYDFAVHYLNELYDLEKMMGNLAPYFDYESFADDLFLGDFVFWRGYVFGM